jgi:uncharacterized protein
MSSSNLARVIIATFIACTAFTAIAAMAADTPPVSDIPENFTMPDAQNDYIKRVEMIPMRDGVKLYTVIVFPKTAKDAPIVLTRTPYSAKDRASNDSPQILSLLSETDLDFARAGYIRVFQDIRGKYGSEGAYEMTRPPRGPLNSTPGTPSTGW